LKEKFYPGRLAVKQVDEHPDPYRTLGILADARDEAVRRAFRELALRHHPDRNPHDAEAPRKFREVKAAYDAIRAMRSKGQPTSRPRSRPATDGRSNSREIDPESRANVHRSLLRLVAAIDLATMHSTAESVAAVIDLGRWCKFETDLALALKGHVDPLRDAGWSSSVYEGPAAAARLIVKFRKLAAELDPAGLDLVELRNLRARLEGLIAVLSGFVAEMRR
jgi:curved DNA-binding protein CbpA